ncbi:MAG: Fumarate hydratase class II [Chlamydiia bacterium]|nr:Fumarate hydratase class II [Chlamydiia bacterium]
MTEHRVESDTIGEVNVPSDKLWGSQTQRSLQNFPFKEKLPPEVYHALAIVKMAAAKVNEEMGNLDPDIAKLIVESAQEVIDGKHEDHFPLSVFQTGSGTQANMNVNEVIANRAIQKSGGTLGSKSPVHPNDHVNRSQSSNDTFPTAMHIAAVLKLVNKTLPALRAFKRDIEKKGEEFEGIVKIGRTHYMDATPLTLSQEFSGFAAQIGHGINALESALPPLYELALGGTAVGTGLNSPPGYAEKAVHTIAQITNQPFVPAPNKFQALAGLDAIVFLSGAIKTVACAMMKIASDIGILGSGPRCGIGELSLPANEPGSSIMPGKVNPTQVESMTMVAAFIIGNDLSVTIGGMSGFLQLNVYRPMAITQVLQALDLIADSTLGFSSRCLQGIEPNRPMIEKHLEHSLMLVTALNPHIGYDKSAEIAKLAHKEHLTLKAAALQLGYLTEAEFDLWVDPKKMV